MVGHLDSQRSEIHKLRQQLQATNRDTVEANRTASFHLAQVLEEEHADAEAEHNTLLSQIKELMEESRKKQFRRLKSKYDGIRTGILSSTDSLEQATAQHDRQVDEWVFKDEQFAKDVTASRDEIKAKMQDDWQVSFHFLYHHVRNCANYVVV